MFNPLDAFSEFKYSMFQRDQKSCRTLVMCYQVDNRLDRTKERSPSGRIVSDFPIKQCANVNTRSFGSEDRDEIGLEFKTASIYMMNVFNSNVNRESLMTRLK